MHDETVRSYHTETAAIEAWRETERQIEKWGVQHHKDFPPFAPNIRAAMLNIPSEWEAKDLCERSHKAGADNWAAIIIEELCEAIGAETQEDLRKELIQVAAVALSWVADIDERTGA